MSLTVPWKNLPWEILPQLQDLDLGSLNLYLGGPVRLNSLRLLVQTGIDLGEDYQVIDNVFQISDLQGVQHLLKRKIGQFHLRLVCRLRRLASGATGEGTPARRLAFVQGGILP